MTFNLSLIGLVRSSGVFLGFHPLTSSEVFSKSPATVLEDALQAALHDSELKSQSADQAAASFWITDDAMISLPSWYATINRWPKKKHQPAFVWKANPEISQVM